MEQKKIDQILTALFILIFTFYFLSLMAKGFPNEAETHLEKPKYIFRRNI